MTLINCENREEWLKERKNGIGASDAAAILGENPWCSPMAVYADKIGAGTNETSERMELGKKLEPFIAERFTEITGFGTQNLGDFTMFAHPEYPFLRATLDRIVQCDCTTKLLEIKTTNPMNLPEWENGPPVYYQIQVQHQFMVTGMTSGYICCMFGTEHVEVYPVEIDPEFIPILIEKELEFWDRVQRREPPPADASESCAKALKALHPKDNGETVILGDEYGAIIEALRTANEQKKVIEKVIDGCKNKLIAAIGDNTFGVVPGIGRLSFKTQTNPEHTVKASTFRVLREVKR
jgi:putative phage-type endonuclease